MAGESRNRLDQPLTPGRLPKRPQWDGETFARLAERFARFLGTWGFIGYMSAFVLLWLIWNTFLPDAVQFDGPPYIGLTLMLSLQASYAAPLILLAQNRQADRDRVALEEDRAQYSRSIADTEYLTREVAAVRIALGDVATRDFLRSELQRLAEDLREDDEETA
jgi:uncharacterized membrane protein